MNNEANQNKSAAQSGGQGANHQPSQLPNADQGSKEGDYKNIETSVNNPSYFDDDYVVAQEDEMANEEKDN